MSIVRLQLKMQISFSQSWRRVLHVQLKLHEDLVNVDTAASNIVSCAAFTTTRCIAVIGLFSSAAYAIISVLLNRVSCEARCSVHTWLRAKCPVSSRLERIDCASTSCGYGFLSS